MSRFSNKTYLQETAAALQPALTFPVDRPGTWGEWRQTLRSTLATLLGGVPAATQPPAADELERHDEHGYTRLHLAIRGRDGVEIPAYLLVPHGIAAGEERPAVLALHGHGYGKGEVVGDPGAESEQEQAARSASIAAHNYDYARRYAQMGFVVLAPDARGFGERAEGSESGCHVPGVISLFLGQPIAGQRLRDDMAALDYLAALPQVNGERIGCAGLSEGGKRTLYLAAMDDRVKAAVISGYYCTLKGAIAEWDRLNGWDICNYVPGLLRYADYPDLAALIAPRPLLIENAIDDSLYHQPAVDEALAVTRRTYEAHAAAGRFDVDLFTGGHRWSGAKALPWMERWL